MRGGSRRRRGTRSSLHAVDATTLLVCFVHADGVIVNDIGLEPLIVALQRLVLLPLARELFSADDRGDPATGFDSTHAFVVKYRADEDSHLDVHTDDSDGR